MTLPRSLAPLTLAGALALLPALSHAALFEDDEARRAIIELRQRVAAQNAAAQDERESMRRAGDAEATQVRRMLQEIGGQLDALRTELAGIKTRELELGRRVRELENARALPPSALDRPHGPER